jgi:hypothetical protein
MCHATPLDLSREAIKLDRDLRDALVVREFASQARRHLPKGGSRHSPGAVDIDAGRAQRSASRRARMSAIKT